uniref:Putative secreted protein n=1 Tax=Anopheles darlingi TaxID=43151 RepID=A0A2M4DHX7_ANODA
MNSSSLSRLVILACPIGCGQSLYAQLYHPPLVVELFSVETDCTNQHLALASTNCDANGPASVARQGECLRAAPPRAAC